MKKMILSVVGLLLMDIQHPPGAADGQQGRQKELNQPFHKPEYLSQAKVAGMIRLIFRLIV